MTRSEYRKHLQTLTDDQLYSTAKKYCGYDVNNLKQFERKLEDIYQECEKRNINIYNSALNDAIDRSVLRKEINRIDFKNDKEIMDLLASRPSAGPGTPVTDEVIIEEADFNSIFKVLKKKNMFVCKARGESMKNVGIVDGSLLFIEKTTVPKHGDIVIAMVDNELYVKKYYRNNGSVELHSENNKYHSVELSTGSTVGIWGVVKAVFNEF